VLGDLDSLGAGFQLASHDLDIRGAGNLLGDEQSGHIREVGFELYQSMLEEAILAAKAEGRARLPPREASAADHRRCADHDPRGLRPRLACGWRSIAASTMLATRARSKPLPPR
jgi:hypothetical protein